MSPRRHEDIAHAETLLKHYHHVLETAEITFVRGSVLPRLQMGIDLTDRQRHWFDAIVTAHLGDTGLTISEEEFWK